MPFMKKTLLPLAAALALSACGAASGVFSKGEPPPGCPDVGFMADAGAAPVFVRDTGTPAPADASIYALLQNLRGDCAKSKDGLEVDFSFDIVAQKTLLGQGIDKQNFSYFIGVIDKDEAILQRRQFNVTVDFGKNESAVQTVEYRVKLPSADPRQALTDRVIVGFALTPQQVAFNKAYPHDIGQHAPLQTRPAGMPGGGS
jgi:hypothetical protein